jgi:hypothetical protein
MYAKLSCAFCVHLTGVASAEFNTLFQDLGAKRQMRPVRPGRADGRGVPTWLIGMVKPELQVEHRFCFPETECHPDSPKAIFQHRPLTWIEVSFSEDVQSTPK